MAHQALDLGMLHQRGRAAEALHRATAVVAHHIRRKAATIEVEDGLLLVLESVGDGLDKAPRQRLAVAGFGLIAHVDELDLGVVAAHPPDQRGAGGHALGRLVVRGDGRCRRAHDKTGSGDRGQPPRHPSRLVARRAVLLVGSRSLLVETDQAQARNGREHRRPAAQHDLGLAPPRPPPLLRALQLGQLRLQHRHGGVQTRSHALHQLRGERDLRHEEQDPQSLRQRPLGRGQVDLGLAAGDDAVEQRDRVRVDHIERRALLICERHALGGRGGARGELEQAGVPALPARLS